VYGRKAVVVVVVENSIAKVYRGKNYQYSFPIKCTFFESASLRASSNGDDASGAFDLQVRQNAIPTRDGISTYSILDIHAECRLNSSSSVHYIQHLYMHVSSSAGRCEKHQSQQ
jgi:hypothetical protein